MSRAHSLTLPDQSYLSSRRELIVTYSELTERSEVNVRGVPTDPSLFLRSVIKEMTRVSKAHSLSTPVTGHLSLRIEINKG